MNRMTNVVQTLCKKVATMPLLKFFGVVTMAVVPSMPIDVRAQAVQVEIAVENLQKGQVVRIVRDVKVVPEEHPADEDQKKRQKVEAKADRNADAEGKEDEKQADEKGKDDKKSKPVKPPKFLRDLVNGEMSFIKRVAKPTDEQMDEIVDRARTMLQEVADDIVHPANKPVRWQQGDFLICLIVSPLSSQRCSSGSSRKISSNSIRGKRNNGKKWSVSYRSRRPSEPLITGSS